MFDRILKYVALWCIGAFVYGIIEIAFKGESHISMGIIGGICFILIGNINQSFGFDIPLFKQSILAKGWSINLPHKVVDDGNFLPFHTIYHRFLSYYNFVYKLYQQFSVKFFHSHTFTDKRNPLTNVIIDFL